MNRKGFLTAISLAPLAALFARKTEAKPLVPVPPLIEPLPAEGVRAGVSFLPEGVNSWTSPCGRMTVRRLERWEPPNPEWSWGPGEMGCCMNRGPSACDLCRKPGVNPEKDKAMWLRWYNSPLTTPYGRELAKQNLTRLGVEVS